MEADIVEYEDTQYVVYPHVLHQEKYFPMNPHYQIECVTRLPIPLDPFVDFMESEPNVLVRVQHFPENPPKLYIVKKNGNWLMRTRTGIAVVLTPDMNGVPTMITMLADSEQCKERFVKTIHSNFI